MPVRADVSGRLETAIATGIGLLALAVSAYTAYVQREQVRAQVWPILEVSSGNEPEVRLWIANKGVGPALIRSARVTLDGKPVRNWHEMLTALYGKGQFNFSQDQIGGRVLSAGEGVPVFVPKGDIAPRFDKDRFRVGMEICYCSTLGDCWRIAKEAHEPPRTQDVHRCPPWEFEQ